MEEGKYLILCTQPFSTKYSLNLFLALTLWMDSFGNHCLSLFDKLLFEFSVNYFIARLNVFSLFAYQFLILVFIK